MRRVLAVTAPWLLAVGCLPQLTVDPDVQLTCASDDDCPEGFQCKVVDGEGSCITNDELGKTAITIVAPLVVSTPRVSLQPDHNVARVTVGFSRAPRDTPFVEMDGRRFSCVEADVEGVADASGEVGFTCETTLDEEVPTGTRRITMVALDAAKNKVTDAADITVDDAAPALVRAEVVGGVDDVQVGAGSSVTVSVILDETPSAFNAQLTPGGETCEEVAVDGVVVRCRVTLAGEAVEGARALSITARDDVDNEATVVSPTILTADATPPAAPTVDVPDAVTLVRAPWGSGDDATPRFAVEATVDAVEAGAALVVFASAAGGAELGRAIVIDDHLEADLGPVDRFEAFVAAVDAAGNSSPRVRVRNQRWTASYGGKVETSRFENPHQAFVLSTIGAALRRDDDAELLDPTPLHPGDTDVVSAAPGASWRQRPPTALPVPRTFGCLAFDQARGQAVLFGGERNAGVLERRDDTWLYRFGEWRLQTPNRAPSPRSRAACAYDPRRDRVVLAGGVLAGGARTDEIWLWDGSNWSQSAARLPVPLADAVAAFDRQRGGVILVGGATGDAGADIRDDVVLIADDVRTLDLSGPAPRRGAGLVPLGDNALLLFGGQGDGVVHADTWRLDGSGWQEVAAAGGPANQTVVAMASAGTAASPSAIILSNQRTVFRFDGASWTSLDNTGGPSLATNARLVPFGTRQLLFAGGEIDAENTTHLFDGSQFRPVRPVLAPLGNLQVAFDGVGQVLVLNGTTLSVDDGLSLQERQTLQTTGVLLSARLGGDGVGRDGPLLVSNTGQIFTFDDELNATRDNAVAAAFAFGAFKATRFGANDDRILASNGSQTFVLDGDTWTAVAGQAPPTTNPDFAVAALDDGVLLVGGTCGGTNPCTTTSFFDGVSWNAPVAMPEPDAGGPVPFGNTTAVSDPNAGTVVVFGGFNNAAGGAGFLADIWETDGVTFAPGPSGPTGRFGHAMVFQPNTGDVLVYGGAVVGSQSDEIWAYHSGASDRPGLRFDISVGSARIAPATISRFEARVRGDAGRLLPVRVWEFGAYRDLVDNGAGVPASPASAGIFIGNEPTLHLTVAADVGATINVDSVDVTLFVQE